MSVTQMAVGFSAVGLVLNALLAAVLPDPSGLIVHGLAYSDGVVTQDRTVLTSQRAFYAQWAASIVDKETGEKVPECVGSGAYPYPPGHKEVRLTLAEWTGNPLCSTVALRPGRTYELIAVWSWGSDSVSASQEFVK